jgi:hypothetical protein
MAGFALARGLKAKLSTWPEPELSIWPRHPPSDTDAACTKLDKVDEVDYMSDDDAYKEDWMSRRASDVGCSR